MSIVETVLVFVGIPAGTYGVFAAVILGPSAVRAPRYRPGSSWDYKPVWYLPHPAPQLQSSGTDEPAARLAVTGSVAEPVAASGGASGEW
jgi:hypothetical protein